MRASAQCTTEAERTHPIVLTGIALSDIDPVNVDQQAWQQPHADLLNRIVAARVPESVVDDVMQEVSLAALRCQDFPKVPEQQRQWLSCVAVRQCALYWRKRPREQSSDRETLQYFEDPEDDPLQWLLARESAQQLHDAIAQLDDEHRQLLIQKFVLGKSYEKISKERSITRHSVEYRIESAKRSLRKLLLSQRINEVE